jgi:hypothetical protein
MKPRKKTTIKEITCKTCGGDAEFVTVLELVPPGFTRRLTCYAWCDTCARRLLNMMKAGPV